MTMRQYVEETVRQFQLEEVEERLAMDMEEFMGHDDPELREMIRQSREIDRAVAVDVRHGLLPMAGRQVA